MTEFIEMETTSSSDGSPSVKTGKILKKVLKHEYELRAFSTRSISHWWVILPVLFYLVVVIGGIMTSISVGNVFAAFENYCIFNANFTLLNIEGLSNKTLEVGNLVINSWGEKNDCLFTEYASVACSLIGGIWIVMVLQCGRGGASRRGFRLPEAWRIVPPTCVCNFILFILSCIVLSRVNSGFTEFCNNIQFKPYPPKEDMSCLDILGLHFLQNKFNTDIAQEYRMSHIGATVQFIGCLLGFLIVTFRCCTGADFETYERKQIAYFRANTTDPPEPSKHNIYDEDDCDDIGYSDKTYPTTSTTVIFHNPTIQVDEADEFGSINSESELISDLRSSKA